MMLEKATHERNKLGPFISKKKIHIICPICSIKHEIYRSDYKRGRRFCSRKCASKWHSKCQLGKIPWNKGRRDLPPPWNKGLTKETDKRVQKNAEGVKRTWYDSIEKRTNGMKMAWQRKKDRGYLDDPKVKETLRQCGIKSIRKQNGWRFVSKPQRKLFGILKKIDPKLELEWKVEIGDRTFFIDIASPEKKLGVEYDGKYWHDRSKKADKEKDKLLKEAGWIIIRCGKSVFRDSKLLEVIKDAIY